MGKSNPTRDILPPIPPKRYFAIGEVAKLCKLQPHVLRYWESEFAQLRPIKRTGNRRYYREHEILLIRRIRELLYDNGFTIQGARQVLRRKGEFADLEVTTDQQTPVEVVNPVPVPSVQSIEVSEVPNLSTAPSLAPDPAPAMLNPWREELRAILKLLSPQ